MFLIRYGKVSSVSTLQRNMSDNSDPKHSVPREIRSFAPTRRAVDHSYQTIVRNMNISSSFVATPCTAIRRNLSVGVAIASIVTDAAVRG